MLETFAIVLIFLTKNNKLINYNLKSDFVILIFEIKTKIKNATLIEIETEFLYELFHRSNRIFQIEIISFSSQLEFSFLPYCAMEKLLLRKFVFCINLRKGCIVIGILGIIGRTWAGI